MELNELKPRIGDTVEVVSGMMDGHKGKVKALYLNGYADIDPIGPIPINFVNVIEQREGVMDKEIKVLKEHDKYYEAIIDNKPVKLFKVGTVDEMKKQSKLRLNRISELITFKDFKPLLDKLYFYSCVSPRVEEYEEVVTEMSKEIKKLYDIVAFAPLARSQTNIFHYYLKQIDPKIYGKAQTFTRITNLLFEDLKYIKEKIDG